jgi:hypothetical protein
MGMSAILAVGTGLSVLGQIQQGQQQADYYEAQAKQSEINAAYTRQDAMTQAEKIRRAGRRQVGETNAQLAASGVKLGEGTPLELTRETIELSEQDAFSAILSGERGYTQGMTEARSMRSAGRNAVSNSILGSAGTIATGWYLGKKGAA